jgi:two-component system response regulator MprA
VIDDDADIRSLLRLSLQLDGHTVRTAADGLEGLVQLRKALAAGELPVVVLDVQMPDMDGWQVLEAIRSDHDVADCAVMLCTVKAGAGDLARGWELGCDAYEAKPFDLGAISTHVAELAALPVDERWRRRRQRTAL